MDGSAAAALGEKSAYQSFLAQMLGGGGGGNKADVAEAAEVRLLDAVKKARQIKEVYERTSHRSQAVLAAWARQDKLSKHWKSLTHVLPLLGQYDPEKHGGRANESLEVRLSVGAASDKQKAMELMLRRAAEVAVAEALADYAGVFDAAAEKGRAA